MTRGSPLAHTIALTRNQHDLHLADQAATDPTTYQTSVVYRIDGPFDDTILQTRLDALVAAHPILTATLTNGPDAESLQLGAVTARLHRSQVPVAPDGPAATRRLRRERLRPLDPRTGPIMRLALLRYHRTSADLVIAAHHLVVDERSTELIARWLLTGDNEPAAAQFGEWAAAAAEADESRHTRIAALRTELAEAGRAATQPGPPAAGRVAGTEGATTEMQLTADTWKAVTELATFLRVTPYSIMVAAAGLTHARAGGGATVVGATFSRRTPRYARTIGYFNATAAIPVLPGEATTVADFIQRTHRRSVRAYRDTDLPLSEVTADGGAPRLVVTPVTPLPELTAGASTAYPHPDVGLGSAQFPLTLYLHPEKTGGVRGLLRYQHAVVPAVAAERFCRQLETVVPAMLTDPQAQLTTISTLTAADDAWIRRTARGDDVTPVTRTLTETFADRVREAGDRIAVSAAGTSLTYAELDARSSLLARTLLAGGVAPGDRVGVCMRRGADLVVALLGVVKAGAAYVPLDPSYPQQRLAFLVEDTGAGVVVTDDSRPIPGVRAVPMTALHDTPAELPTPDPERIAYIIHTSGSTGRPKGVAVRHRNLAALLDATREELALSADDVWTAFHSLAFDFSVWEIWGCLLTGGRLVVIDHDVARDPQLFHETLRTERVSVLSQTPSAFSQLTSAAAFAAGGLAVRLVVLGGETLDARTLLPWFDTYPERVCRCVNMYGITETTVHATWHTLRRADALTGGRSVGRPLPGWELYVVDDAGRLTPPGVPGEIYVGGAGVTAGYLHRPDLTAQRFVPDRITGADRLLYRSGDIGCYRESGELEHLGRGDEQVKLRGHRIELGEIRHALLADPRVRAAAVIVRQPGDAATARIDAYAVADPPHAGDIHDGLRQRLPRHMVPATVTAVAELPLTGNGKLDISRLPLPAASPGPAGPSGAVPAQTGIEADATLGRIIATWQAVIGVPVGPDDNFLDLGGNSLLAVRLLDALRTQGFTTAQLRDIFRHATPRRLDAAMTGAAR